MDYFKLIRWVNLLIIGMAMVCLGIYFDVAYQDIPLLVSTSSKRVLLGMLVLSIILIAAGGYVINDIFDIETDKINKPEEWIVGNVISVKNAYVLYIVLNVLAFLLGLFMSLKLYRTEFLLINVLLVYFLWLYSKHLKSRPLIGNIVSALLTSSATTIVGFFYIVLAMDNPPQLLYPFFTVSTPLFPLYLGLVLSLFAFLLNFAREIIKDIEDIDGDKKSKLRTFPIVFGVKKAKVVALFLLMIILFLTFPIIYFKQKGVLVNVAFSLFYLSVLLAGISGVFLLKAKEVRTFKKADFLLKLAMVVGVLLPLSWVVLSGGF